MEQVVEDGGDQALIAEHGAPLGDELEGLGEDGVDPIGDMLQGQSIEMLDDGACTSLLTMRLLRRRRDSW